MLTLEKPIVKTTTVERLEFVSVVDQDQKITVAFREYGEKGVCLGTCSQLVFEGDKADEVRKFLHEHFATELCAAGQACK